MPQLLHTLEDEDTPRTSEEYLGAFTENLNMILHLNPVERTGMTVMLAAKTAMRLKAANPRLKEHDIARMLQSISRNVRLAAIIKDLTPEEKRILKLHSKQPAKALSRPERNNGRKRA